MKFVADIMVGKLAKYLRMAGYDVKYINNVTDEELTRIAKNEKRILLTRDSLLLMKKEFKNEHIKAILIKGDNLIEQLEQVKSELGIRLKPNLIRCLKCNQILTSVDKKEVKDKVPPYVYATQQNFLYCKNCSQYYWRGTHYDNIKDIFQKIREKHN